MLNYFKKMRQQKRQYRAYKRRVATLPAPFEQALTALEKYLWNWAGSDEMYTVLDNVLEMFESAAADGLTVNQVVGPDIAVFADNLLAEFPQATWVNKQRQKLQHDANKQ